MSYKLKINEKNIDRVIAQVDVVAKTLSKLILKTWQINILESGNVDTGEYSESIKIEQISNGKWRIFSDKDYSVYVEYGTGPAVGKDSYIPPLEPILKWVEHKLGYSGDEAKAVAWFIIRKIEQEGIEPSPSARNSLQQTSYRSLNIAKEILLKVMK